LEQFVWTNIKVYNPTEDDLFDATIAHFEGEEWVDADNIQERTEQFLDSLNPWFQGHYSNLF
jgi:hypothetical protein